MEPTISTGALLVAKQTDIAQIREGDIICFRSKEPLVYGEIVTHRVVEKQTGEDGNDYLKTRGDANSAVDGFLVSEEELVGRVVWYTGQKNVFTGILSLLTTRYGFLSCILLPILVIAILIMRDSIRSIRQELYLMQQELEKREQEEAAEEPLEDALWSPEEYEELVNRLKRELIEELSEHAEIDDTGDIHGQGK
jgi:signal peptidase I